MMNRAYPVRSGAGGAARETLRRGDLLCGGRSVVWVWVAMVLVVGLGVMEARAARIGDVGELDVWTQMLRFVSLKDPSVRYALVGSMLLGLCCGLLGSFVVVRKMALVGDALSHAVLPGVALGFLWGMSKDPVAIFVGAVAAGLLGSAVVSWIQQTTRLKEDTALGLVLAVFFAVGMCLMTMIQQLPMGSKSGLDKFLFGQAAAMGSRDVGLMAVVAVLTVVLIVVLYKEFLVTSFDAGFARAVGMPARALHYVMMLLLAFAVVVALQAVGVVLVSAMLITPAATAYLLTDRMHRMLWVAAVLGMGAGVLGAFGSFLGSHLPTGPLMVLSASALFTLAFLFAPRHGILARWWRQRSKSSRIRRENTLKSIYHVLEARQFEREGVTLRELAERRRETLEEVRGQAEELRRHELATLHEDGNLVFVTPEGWKLACNIVRNHRLWELYLTNQAQIAADHVHEDAEKIEHVLGEETVRMLERKLEFATTDPHGRRIPSFEEMQMGLGQPKKGGRSPGYG